MKQKKKQKNRCKQCGGSATRTFCSTMCVVEHEKDQMEARYGKGKTFSWEVAATLKK